MNKYIWDQLQKVTVADLPPYDQNTTKLVIPKKEGLPTQGEPSSFIPGHFYIVELEDYIVHPPENFSLHQNWNNNVVPQVRGYRCYCVQLMGKMVKIDGVGYDWKSHTELNTAWSGWVPLKSIKIIQEVPAQ